MSVFISYIISGGGVGLAAVYTAARGQAAVMLVDDEARARQRQRLREMNYVVLGSQSVSRRAYIYS